MKEQEREDYVVDCLVTLDGRNKPFFSYVPYDVAQKIQEIGLENAETIIFRETEDRKIPKVLVDGLACITDVYVRLEPDVVMNLN